MRERVNVDWSSIEAKWLNRWGESRVFEADPKPGKKKFFITVAYPYPNSPQHIGHGRTYTLADTYARYLRMKGYNVLFPMGFHYTGTPVLAMAKRLRMGDRELAETFTRVYKVPEVTLTEFNEPMKIAQYFHREIKEGMKSMGYSIDWRREFTTIDPPYSKFIEWQFEVLREKGLIKKGSHPVGWCPICGNPVGQHDTVGDVEPEIEEFTLIKFQLPGSIAPTATLRPETVYGVTNIWVNPESEYVEAEVDGETWIVSREASEKLKLLNRAVKVKRSFKGHELLGQWAVNPANGSRIPILPAGFVDPDNATGVVMSVPAHAPYDFQALLDLKRSRETLKKYGISPSLVEALKPLSIIFVEGYASTPAEEAVLRRKIKDQNDPRLEEATEEVYSREFHKGVMAPGTEPYAGLPVQEAKRRLIEDFLKSGKADKMYEIINKPVTCRCGAQCVVKVFEDQWFIDYGDHEWKSKAMECLSEMRILPEEIRAEFEYTVGWLREKACARRGGLGTKLPWDKRWVIESLSDSVIYMAYYTIAHLIQRYNVDGEKLNKHVFDYIFLGQGDPRRISKETGVSLQALKAMRDEFQYFYPLDSRHSGRDLVPNHLTFFIFNHVAIFPPNLWPKQIVVNGSVLMEGKKMSKSFGNIIPLKDGVKEYGADALRLAILSTAGLLQDVDFSPNLARSLRERLERLYWTALETAAKPGPQSKEEPAFGLEERWLFSRLNRAVKNVTEAMEELRVRDAVQMALYNLDHDVQWYMRKALSDASPDRIPIIEAVLRRVLEVRVKLLAPFAPFICEEIWEMLGGEGFVSTSEWPRCDEKALDPEAEEAVELIRKLVEDVSNIVKATGISPRRIIVYTCAPWKTRIYREILQTPPGKLRIAELINKARRDIDLKGADQQISRCVNLILKETSTMPEDLKKRKIKALDLDEKKLLLNAKSFLEKELKATLEVYGEEDPEKYDPKSRAPLSQPLRPAIFIE